MAMRQDGARPEGTRRRWVAPVLLLGLAAVLGPVWWEMTAPPAVGTARPWRDAAGTLVVPRAAVRNMPPDDGLPGGPHVFRVEDGVVRRIRVELGAIRQDGVEIRAGLAEGVVIAANPPRGLEDRHRVVVRP